MKLSENAKEWIKDIGTAIILSAVILFFVRPTIVKESSMSNTLLNNDYVFVSRQSYTIFGEMKRGDIVVFKSNMTSANGARKLLVKRVIALPGDTISITGGKVYLNGEAIDEPYTKEGYTGTEMAEITIPEGRIFVMGDNRQNSSDSRSKSVGLVAFDDVVGKVVFRLYPFNKMGSVYK